ncbi:MAG: NUDIX domain-containing protein [Caldilineaceae bacterium]|nr:NUDIX domain-containing protein [Caldilineaceae bacterium]
MTESVEKIRRYASAGGIVIDGQRMLLLDRPSRQEVRLPKGHIDPGETPEVAALRETQEESGYCDLIIAADLGHQVVGFEHQGQHYLRTEYYFLMTLGSEQQSERPAEDQAQFQVRWVPLAEAVAKLTFEAEKRMAQRAIDAYARL